MYRVITTFCFLSAFFPAVLWALGGTSTESPARVDPSVVEGADKYLKAVLAGDTSAIAAMYRDDAALMPAECPLLRGRAAIEGYYREWFKGPAKVTGFTFTHLESPVLGETAYDVGTYRQTLSLGAGGTVNISGKYSVILKRLGADWKIAYLIFNSDSPSQMPLPASGGR
jgi:ketosteroid isomerase-like protein